MSPLHPSSDVLRGTVYSPLSAKSRTPYEARLELFPAYSSVIQDAKGKAKELSAEATAEFEKASAKAQAKAGKIELYSGKYYAACTFGGLMACVSVHLRVQPRNISRSTNFQHKETVLIRIRVSLTLP